MNDMSVDIVDIDGGDYFFEYDIGEEENIIYIIEDHRNDGFLKITIRKDNLLCSVNQNAKKHFREELLSSWSIKRLYVHNEIVDNYDIFPSFYHFNDVRYKIICENEDVISFCPYVLPDLHETQIHITAIDKSGDLIYRNRAKLYLQFSDKCFFSLIEKFGDNKIHMLVENHIQKLNEDELDFGGLK